MKEYITCADMFLTSYLYNTIIYILYTYAYKLYMFYVY